MLVRGKILLSFQVGATKARAFNTGLEAIILNM